MQARTRSSSIQRRGPHHRLGIAVDEPVEELRDRRQHGQSEHDGTDNDRIVHRHAPATVRRTEFAPRLLLRPPDASPRPKHSDSAVVQASSGFLPASACLISRRRTLKRGDDQMAKRGKPTKTKTPQRGGPGAKVVSEGGKLPAKHSAADFVRRRTEVERKGSRRVPELPGREEGSRRAQGQGRRRRRRTRRAAA